MTNNQLTDELRVLAYVERLKAAATVYLDVSAKDVPFYDKAVARRPFDLLLHPSDLLILIASYEAKEAELQELRKAAMDSESVGNEFIPKNLDKALGVVGMALPESKEEFNFQIERWIQRLIDRVIRYADEFKEQPAPVTTSEEHRQLRDLVMMVKMLCRTVRKYNPESQQAANFTAYLQKEGLISAADCLRDSARHDTDSEGSRG